jgi:cobalt/nickel transport system permease protein
VSDVPLSLFAVHLSDGALGEAWWGTGFAGAAVLLLVAVWRMREEEISRIGVLTAAFFVASSVHIKLVLLPTSVHLILNGLVGVVLGRRAPLAVAVGLALQYLLLSHGGLTTIGINTCIVGLPALAAGIAYPLLRRIGVPAFARGVLLGGGAVAGAVVLNFLALFFGGKEDWQTLAKLVLLAHVPVVLLEGAMLGVLVRYLEKVKPELLRAEHAAEPPTRSAGPP